MPLAHPVQTARMAMMVLLARREQQDLPGLLVRLVLRELEQPEQLARRERLGRLVLRVAVCRSVSRLVATL